MAISEDPPRLTVSARYRLEVLSRGPRMYRSKDHQILALARRGLVEPLPNQNEGGPRTWTLTEAGRAAMATFSAATIASIARWKEEP
jgi:hypothetical protein